MMTRASRFILDAPGALLLLAALATLPGIGAAQLPAQVPSLAPMIEQVSPAVVNISVTGEELPELPRGVPDSLVPPAPQGSGSGVIFDAENGYIVTNHHVVEDASAITVTLLDSRTFDARVVGTDRESDVAVLQIDADGLNAIAFGDSDRVRVGDFVVAIGNPFGLSHSVTSGIVSGLGRNNINPYRYAYEDFIQTDASINPGNSGGALVGLNGDLLGINSAIFSQTGGNIGIGFAIPVNLTRYVMDQLVETGTVKRGRLGVEIVEVTREVAAAQGLPAESGAQIAYVTRRSGAARAGLEADDVIVSVNGRPVRNPGSLRNAIGLLPPGARVTVGFFRDGQERRLDAILGETRDDVLDGIELVENAPSGPSGGGAGALVERLQGEREIRQGLRVGDVIIEVNGRPVMSPEEAIEAAQAAEREDAESVVLRVQRGERTVSITMR